MSVPQAERRSTPSWAGRETGGGDRTDAALPKVRSHSADIAPINPRPTAIGSHQLPRPAACLAMPTAWASSSDLPQPSTFCRPWRPELGKPLRILLQEPPADCSSAGHCRCAALVLLKSPRTAAQHFAGAALRQAQPFPCSAHIVGLRTPSTRALKAMKILSVARMSAPSWTPSSHRVQYQPGCLIVTRWPLYSKSRGFDRRSSPHRTTDKLATSSA